MIGSVWTLFSPISLTDCLLMPLLLYACFFFLRSINGNCPTTDKQIRDVWIILEVMAPLEYIVERENVARICLVIEGCSFVIQKLVLQDVDLLEIKGFFFVDTVCCPLTVCVRSLICPGSSLARQSATYAWGWFVTFFNIESPPVVLVTSFSK